MDTDGGYDYKFLDSDLATDYECILCHYTARNPQQAQCCGATYCSSCIERSRRTCPECPNCRAPSFILIRDEAQQRRINKLRIQCSHCEWTGALSDIQTHMALDHPDFEKPGAKEKSGPLSGSAPDSEREATEHAHSLEWSFSDFQKPCDSHSADDEDDGPASDEREPLIELKRLATEEDHPSLNDSSENIVNSSDCSERGFSTGCFSSLYCTDIVYASKTTKWYAFD